MKIVAMIAARNEEDIIKETIEHLLSQGLEVVVLDNNSSDQTYAICKKYLGNGVLDLFKLKSPRWDLAVNLQILYQMALRQKPDWVVLNDADELLESGTNNSLKEEIIKVDDEGYNLIQFNGFNFYMTDNDVPDTDLIKERLPYYSHTGDGIFRAWKYQPGIWPEWFGGHLPVFPEGVKYQIYPQKFILRHYRFRSTEQTKRKMQERLERRSKQERQIGWHIHLDVIVRQDFTKKVDHNLLTKYEEDNSWNCELKYRPFSPPNEPINARENFFSEDGFLKFRPPKYSQLRATVKNQREKIIRFEKIIQNKNSSWPNLFIVGAPRCATTSIFRYLSEVQGICVCEKKEPHYFADFSVPKNDRVLKPVREKNEYLGMFNKKQDDKFLCEASTHYLADRVTPFLIKKIVPGAKIIINLRDPIERAFSFYLHIKRGGWIEDSFSEMIKKEFENKSERNKPHSILRHGLYNENVRRYTRIFKKQNIKLIFFEELIENPKTYFMGILKFLNLENVDCSLNFKEFNKGPLGYSMTDEDRNLLKEFYKEDVRKLEEFLDRKFPWQNFNQ